MKRGPTVERLWEYAVRMILWLCKVIAIGVVIAFLLLHAIDKWS